VRGISFARPGLAHCPPSATHGLALLGCILSPARGWSRAIGPPTGLSIGARRGFRGTAEGGRRHMNFLSST